MIKIIILLQKEWLNRDQNRIPHLWLFFPKEWIKHLNDCLLLRKGLYSLGQLSFVIKSRLSHNLIQMDQNLPVIVRDRVPGRCSGGARQLSTTHEGAQKEGQLGGEGDRAPFSCRWLGRL